MMRLLKRMMLVIAGVGSLGFAAGFCVILWQYLFGGAGLQVFGFFFSISSTTVLMGLVHSTGLLVAACLCFSIGAVLFAHGVASLPERSGQKARSSDDRDED